MGRNGIHRASGHRAVGYVRRSTDRQEQSIADQKRALEAYAGEHGLQLGKFYIDDAVSGTSTVGRRAFQQMMLDAQKPEGPFDVIVVYDVKRFGRVDNDEAGYYRHVLRNHGVEVATPARTSTAMPPTICCVRSNSGRPARSPRICPK